MCIPTHHHHGRHSVSSWAWESQSKVVAITGANKGLGFATAKIFAEKNAEVHLLCRDKSKGDEAKTRLMEILTCDGKNIYSHECNASEMKSIREFSKTLNKLNKLDVLVNNAGGMPATKTLTNDNHDTIMASALGGTMLLTQLCLPALSKSENGGRVINVVSGGAYTVNCPDPKDLDFINAKKYNPTLFYAFAKRAQIILTDLWPEKLKSISNDSENFNKIRFYSMHPGWAETEGVADALESGNLGLSSTEGFRSAEQGADTILFLGSTNRDDIINGNKDGEMWFDRTIVSKHMGMGTKSSDSKNEELWEEAIKYVGGFDNNDNSK